MHEICFGGTIYYEFEILRLYILIVFHCNSGGIFTPNSTKNKKIKLPHWLLLCPASHQPLPMRKILYLPWKHFDAIKNWYTPQVFMNHNWSTKFKYIIFTFFLNKHLTSNYNQYLQTRQNSMPGTLCVKPYNKLINLILKSHEKQIT